MKAPWRVGNGFGPIWVRSDPLHLPVDSTGWLYPKSASRCDDLSSVGGQLRKPRRISLERMTENRSTYHGWIR